MIDQDRVTTATGCFDSAVSDEMRDTLPIGLRAMARNTLSNPRSSADGILILADGLDELAAEYAAAGCPTQHEAATALATLLRDLAPEYA